MEKKVKVGDKEIVLKKIAYLDGIDIEDLRQQGKLREAASKMLSAGAEISSEDISKLNVEEGILLQGEVNKHNNLENFQQSQGE